ncbi:MAG: hypothetical protein JWL86_6962, partial [Rhizobium sp.]|nr:hypothetical protein [Rhizobium sp.]
MTPTDNPDEGQWLKEPGMVYDPDIRTFRKNGKPVRQAVNQSDKPDSECTCWQKQPGAVHYRYCPSWELPSKFKVDKPDSVDQPTLEQLQKDILYGLWRSGRDGQDRYVAVSEALQAINNHQIRMLQQLREKMTIFPPNGVYDISMFAVTVNDLD